MASIIIPVSRSDKLSHPQVVSHRPRTESVWEGQSKFPTANYLHHRPGLTPTARHFLFELLLPPRASQLPPLRPHFHSSANKDAPAQERWQRGERSGWTHTREHLGISDVVKNVGLLWEFSHENIWPQGPISFPEPSRCLLPFSEHA